jgi:hypothetical protein
MKARSAAPILLSEAVLSATRRVGVAVAAGTLVVACSRADAPSPYQFEAQARAVVTPDERNFRDPRLSVDTATGSGGVVYLLAVAGRAEPLRLVLLTSDDAGDAFGHVAAVSAANSEVSSHGENSPQLLAFNQDAMYAAWEQTVSEREDLVLAASQDFGDSFLPPTRITDKEPSARTYSGYVSIARAPDGSVYATWLDWRDQAANMDAASVYLARSSDQGRTFGLNVRVAAGVCPCCRPAVVVGEKGEVAVIYRNVYPGSIRDMASKVSYDQGNTFQGPFRVAEDGWKIEGCPDSGAATARIGARIFAAWLTDAAPDRSGIRFAWSDDGGRTFSPALLASQDVLDANHPSLAVTPEGRLLLVFSGRDRQGQSGSWSRLRPYIVEVDADGRLSRPLQIPVADDAPSSVRPVVAAGSLGRLFVAWTERGDAGPRVMLIRGRRLAMNQ